MMEDTLVEDRGNAPMRHRAIASALALVTLAAGCGAEGGQAADRVVTDTELGARIDAVAEQALAELPLAGMSIAVGRGGEIAFAAGYGDADVAGDVPAGARTVYPIGSISKQFTAATVLRLAEEGALSLDDPVSRFVPVPDADPPPTVRQLLSHTSGLTDVGLGPALERTSDGIGMDWGDAVELATTPGYWVPAGGGFEYSNGGYLISYGVVEAAAGRPYRSELERLLADAELEDTSVCTGTADDGATGYQQQHDLWDRAARLGRPPGLQPAAAYNADLLNVVCSTAPDLVRWAYRLRAGEVVTEPSYRSMTERVTLTDGAVVPYGLGLQRRRFGEHEAIAHGGILTGYVAMLADFPADDTTVAFLINTDLDEHQTATILTHLLGAVFDEPPGESWLPDPALDPSALEEP